jgi:ketosteroid isomerase-like protein
MDEARAWIARAAITELITRYAALNDTADWEAVAALYTEDGRMARPTAPDQYVTGRAMILAAFRARPPRASRHIVANVLITLEGELRARASSQILLYTGSAAADGGLPRLSPGPPLIGSFEDTLVKTAQGWRFAERRGSLDFRADG